MKRLRKGIAVFLLSLVIFPLMSVVLFHMQQHSIRAAVKKAFKQKELSTIRIQQLHWYEADKEILVDGVLFDVSSIELQPDGMYLVKGLFDHQEQELHRQMDAATHSQKDIPLLLAGAFCCINCEHPVSSLPDMDYRIIDVKWNQSYVNLIAQFEPGILYPPPKCI